MGGNVIYKVRGGWVEGDTVRERLRGRGGDGDGGEGQVIKGVQKWPIITLSQLQNSPLSCYWR